MSGRVVLHTTTSSHAALLNLLMCCPTVHVFYALLMKELAALVSKGKQHYWASPLGLPTPFNIGAANTTTTCRYFGSFPLTDSA